MKETMRKNFAFLIIWICSGVCFFAFQNDNVLVGLVSAVLSLFGYWLMR